MMETISADGAEGAEGQDELAAFTARVEASRVLSYVVVAFCVGNFALERLFGGTAGLTYVFWHMGAGDRASILGGDVWRLVAPMFLHGNEVHLLFNVMACVSFWPVVEAVFGRARTWLLYAAGGVFSSVFPVIFRPESTGVGASGAIFALLAAAAVVVLQPEGLVPAAYAQARRSGLFKTAAINVAVSLAPGIDGLGHLGGAVAGAGLAWWFARARRTGTAMDEKRLVPVAWGVAAACVASVAWADLSGRAWEVSAPRLQRVGVPGVALTIELPGMLERSGRESDGHRFRVHWGTLQNDPIELRMEVQLPDDAAEAAEPEQAFLDSMAEWIGTFPGKSPAKQLGKTEERRFGPHRAMVSRWAYGPGIVLERIGLRVNGLAVFVDSYQCGETPPVWVDLVPEIVGSISAVGAAPSK